MSSSEQFSEQNVTAFIELLNNEVGLFSHENLVELQQLIDSLPDDVEEISKVLCAWYEERKQICNAQLAALKKNIESGTRIIPDEDGNLEKPPKPSEELNKKTFQNALKKASESIDGNQSSQPEE